MADAATANPRAHEGLSAATLFRHWKPALPPDYAPGPEPTLTRWVLLIYMLKLRIDHYHHAVVDLDINRQFDHLKELMMATNAEFVAALADVSARLDAIAARVDAIKAVAGNTTPEEDAAIADIRTKVDALAAKVA